MDDNKEICESLSKLFIEEGQNVYTVTNGALSKLRKDINNALNSNEI